VAYEATKEDISFFCALVEKAKIRNEGDTPSSQTILDVVRERGLSDEQARDCFDRLRKNGFFTEKELTF
jgi:hypothetical protein